MAKARRKAAKGAGDLGSLVDLQHSAFMLGLKWVEMSAGATAVIARRTMMMGEAMLQPAKLADPEFALMVTEKMAAMGEAAERASRHALRRGRPRSPAAELAASLDMAQSCLRPFGRRVRANVKRLG